MDGKSSGKILTDQMDCESELVTENRLNCETVNNTRSSGLTLDIVCLTENRDDQNPETQHGELEEIHRTASLGSEYSCTSDLI